MPFARSKVSESLIGTADTEDEGGIGFEMVRGGHTVK